MRNSDQARLASLAEQAGLIGRWEDVHGRRHAVEPPTLQALLQAMDLPCLSNDDVRASMHKVANESYVSDGQMLVTDVATPITFRLRGSAKYCLQLEGGGQRSGTAEQIGNGKVRIPVVDAAGYHKLLIDGMEMTLAVAPLRCPSVADIMCQPVPRAWGLAAQVYSLWRSGAKTSLSANLGGAEQRSRTGGAIGAAGDYGAISELGWRAARAGASALAISPVHAMFSADPSRYSPYAPSSRLFLNALYVDPAMVLGGDAVRAALGGNDADFLTRAAGDGMIDWPSVAPARMHVLRQVYERFLAAAPNKLWRSFLEFRRAGGPTLQAHANYEALHAHHAGSLGAASGWKDWPATYLDFAGPGVSRFAEHQQKEVGFHVFLQWLASEGLRQAHHRMCAAGAPIGLITDLAIGADGRGSHVWSHQTDFLDGVSVGAPPDLLYDEGQDWGLAAFSPRALRSRGYASFIETLRATMAHAGGVRIDHILGLARMWLVPQGASPSEGVYLRFPFQDMLNLLVLEAARRNVVIIGENLGTVPDGFNERLASKGIMGSSVLWFEKDESAYTPSRRWSSHAVAMSSTHDLPTIVGWWNAFDIQLGRRVGSIGDEKGDQMLAKRQQDKSALWRALAKAGLVLERTSENMRLTPPLEAVLAFVASSPAPLAVIPMEDILGIPSQPNLPASGACTAPAYPSWVQRLPIAVEHIFDQEGVRASLAALRRARYAP